MSSARAARRLGPNRALKSRLGKNLGKGNIAFEVSIREFVPSDRALAHLIISSPVLLTWAPTNSAYVHSTRTREQPRESGMKWCKHRGCCRRLTPTFPTSTLVRKVTSLSTSGSRITSIPERTLVIPLTRGRSRPKGDTQSFNVAPAGPPHAAASGRAHGRAAQHTLPRSACWAGSSEH
jgi:hypothetical protein